MVIDGLKEAGLRTTVPRLKILKILEDKGKSHLSAEDVYRILIESGDDVGIATVYRVLAQFESAGVVKKHTFNSERSVYELAEEDHHDHIICTQCGKIEEFFDPELEAKQESIAAKFGFRLFYHDMNMYGLCASCLEKRGEPR
ncbi:MAG: ferric iron uptake transcriptional regulator [Sedimenticola sp.]